jgi:AraC family transcriptional regulator, arabinose operon regulatory protein
MVVMVIFLAVMVGEVYMMEEILQVYPQLQLQKNEGCYYQIGDDFTNGVMSCGFIRKDKGIDSQYNLKLQFYSCFLLLSGKGTYRDKWGKEYPLQAGSLVQRIPNEIHTTEVEGDDWLEFFINFGKSTFEYLHSMKMIPIEEPVRTCLITSDVIRYLIFQLECFKKVQVEELPIYLMELQKMVIQLHKSCISSTLSNRNILMLKAKNLLSSNLEEDVSLESLAMDLGMSYENFRKVFRETQGVSPMQFRTSQRMHRAKLMILSGISIKETAELVGYSDCYGFSRQFKKTIGVSPAVYRNMKS